MALDFSKYTGHHRAACDSCEFYDYDELCDEYSCSLSLDEDEMVEYLSGMSRECKYYRYYDEYKSVHKQI